MSPITVRRKPDPCGTALEEDWMEWRLNAGQAQMAWPGGDALLHPTGTSFGRPAFERLQVGTTNGRVVGAVPASLGLRSLGSEPSRRKPEPRLEIVVAIALRSGMLYEDQGGQESPEKVAVGSFGKTPLL